MKRPKINKRQDRPTQLTGALGQSQVMTELMLRGMMTRNFGKDTRFNVWIPGNAGKKLTVLTRTISDTSAGSCAPGKLDADWVVVCRLKPNGLLKEVFVMSNAEANARNSPWVDSETPMIMSKNMSSKFRNKWARIKDALEI